MLILILRIGEGGGGDICALSLSLRELASYLPTLSIRSHLTEEEKTSGKKPFPLGWHLTSKYSNSVPASLQSKRYEGVSSVCRSSSSSSSIYGKVN
ncbi:hypothetical protein PVAG01_09371 [Phlyctema vagabunda]|uniref:Uncharacterized protein n=1 Tax=Phlyctema vagabunda TaxID=108571 RepID=A0ABR4P769_9HELO